MVAVLKPRGISCPQCSSTDATPTQRKRPMAGLRVRYMLCNGCGCRFKTAERIVGLTKPPWNGKRTGSGSAPGS